MPQYSGFFVSEVDENGEYDRRYTAEQFAYYFSKFIGNGVYMVPSDRLQVYQNPQKNMSVNISVGDAYINGYFYKNTTIANLPIEIASGPLNRIDMVILRWENLDRSIKLAILKGEESQVAEAPQLTRNEDVYEICLAKVSISGSTVAITDALISDTRGDNELCGFVHGVIDQVDTTTLWNQYAAKFEELYQKYVAELKAWVEEYEDNYVKFTEEYSEKFNNWFNDLTANWSESDYGQMADKIESDYAKVTEQVASDYEKVKEHVDSINKKVSVTIIRNGWKPYADDRFENVHYKYEYEDTGCNDDTFVCIVLDVGSREIANRCKLLPICESKTKEDGSTGVVTLYSEKALTGDLKADLYFNN